MKNIQLGRSGLHVTPICLGTMTFGEQVDEATSHAILSRSLERGINFLDTAEMYPVPTKAETFKTTEAYMGNWFAQNPGARQKLVLATKVAGPARGMPWVRGGSAANRCHRPLPNSLAGAQHAHLWFALLRPEQGPARYRHRRAA
jgi:aryl-alcohol dehydrogenase-like predicted oxidoreductase